MEKATCTKCGDCCETIWVKWSFKDLDYAVAKFPPNSAYGNMTNNNYDAWFIKKYWKIVDERDGRTRFSCEWWDKETRLCTAHDSRPPICKNFPWYGKEPVAAALDPLPRCSFWQDVIFKGMQ